MLSENKEISTPEYWRQIYEGERKNAKTDSSNFKRPANAFDRFQWLADQVEGTRVLDIASGHATTMKRVKSMHPEWKIICSDQTPAARQASGLSNDYYKILDAYEVWHFQRMGNDGWIKQFDSVCVSQALEYFEYPDRFMKAAQTIGKYFVCTIPIGNMEKWSQLRIYTVDGFKEWISQYGEIIYSDQQGDLLLVKLKFN